MASLPVRFTPRSPLQTDLRTAVDAWFNERGLQRTAHRAQQRKVVILLTFWVATIAAYFLVVPGVLGSIAMGILTGMAMAGVGFSVMHDANHHAFSRNARINGALGYTLDLLGGSSFLWRVKHNQAHHAFTNMVGLDDDIELGKLARMAPSQERMSFHRFQHLYMWPLYGFLTIKWHWFDDFYQIARGRIGGRTVPKLGLKQWVLLLVGRAIFFTYALVLPIAVAGVGPGLAFYFGAHLILGVTLAVVFQLAHCVETTDFLPISARGEAVDFARHQLATTVDFAPGNRFITWFVGGLNHQAVHHLFPSVSHGWYPSIAPVVARVAAEHGVALQVIPTFREAVASHYRFLKRLGQPDAVPAAVVASTPA